MFVYLKLSLISIQYSFISMAHEAGRDKASDDKEFFDFCNTLPKLGDLDDKSLESDKEKVSLVPVTQKTSEEASESGTSGTVTLQRKHGREDNKTEVLEPKRPRLDLPDLNKLSTDHASTSGDRVLQSKSSSDPVKEIDLNKSPNPRLSTEQLQISPDQPIDLNKCPQHDVGGSSEQLQISPDQPIDLNKCPHDVGGSSEQQLQISPDQPIDLNKCPHDVGGSSERLHPPQVSSHPVELIDLNVRPSDVGQGGGLPDAAAVASTSSSGMGVNIEVGRTQDQGHGDADVQTVDTANFDLNDVPRE